MDLLSLIFFLFLGILFSVCWSCSSKFTLSYARNLFNQNIIANCPTIKTKKFFPTPYLFCALLQTWFVNAKREDSSGLEVKCERVPMPNGGSVTLEEVYDVNSKNKPTNRKTIVVIIAGGTSDSKTAYVISMTKALIKQGFQVVIYLARFNGIINDQFTFPNTGHIDQIDDFSNAMKNLRSKYQDYKFFAVGHSYGANLLLNYLGSDNGKENIFKGGVSLANPLDFRLASLKLNNSLLDRLMTKSILEILRNSNLLRTLPAHLNVNDETLMKSRSIKEFDSLLTSKLFGFKDVDEYYWGISSIRRIETIRVPVLMINAEDDPLIDSRSYPVDSIADQNKNIILLVTKKGGHMGWFHGLFSIKRWYLDPVIEYLTYLDTDENSTLRYPLH